MNKWKYQHRKIIGTKQCINFNCAKCGKTKRRAMFQITISKYLCCKCYDDSYGRSFRYQSERAKDKRTYSGLKL